MGMYIRTRGSRIDYSFLPQQPERKDLSDYKSRSDFEKPTCILERLEQGKLYLFLSGIPSQRKDHQGTPLRYDLVVTMKSENWVDDGDNDRNTENINGLINLIWMWLDDVRKALQETQEEGKSSKRVRLPAIAKSNLGERLDATFSEEYIEELLKLTLERNWTESDQINLNSKLNHLISQILLDSDLPNLKCDYQSWWGGVDNDESCNIWLKLVNQLLKGETQGKALLLNIATPKSLSRLLVEEEQLGVLLAKECYGSKPKQIEPIDLSEPGDPTTSDRLKKIAKPFIKWGINSLNRIQTDPSNPQNWNSDPINEYNNDEFNEKKKG
ncbi:MAG: hypothetical protein SWJ54_10140 [Cyanobacteriota bacterium]|nr:hypothetical protein [Cyanobacteriota bacterium]